MGFRIERAPRRRPVLSFPATVCPRAFAPGADAELDDPAATIVDRFVAGRISSPPEEPPARAALNHVPFIDLARERNMACNVGRGGAVCGHEKPYQAFDGARSVELFDVPQEQRG